MRNRNHPKISINNIIWHIFPSLYKDLDYFPKYLLVISPSLLCYPPISLSLGKSLVSPGICSPSRLKVPSSFSLEPKGMRQQCSSRMMSLLPLSKTYKVRARPFFFREEFGEMRCQMNCKPYVLNRMSVWIILSGPRWKAGLSQSLFWWFPTSHFSVSACKLWKTTKTFSVYKKSNRRTGHLHVQRWPPFCRHNTIHKRLEHHIGPSKG